MPRSPSCDACEETLQEPGHRHDLDEVVPLAGAELNQERREAEHGRGPPTDRGRLDVPADAMEEPHHPPGQEHVRETDPREEVPNIEGKPEVQPGGERDPVKGQVHAPLLEPAGVGISEAQDDQEVIEVDGVQAVQLILTDGRAVGHEDAQAHGREDHQPQGDQLPPPEGRGGGRRRGRREEANREVSGPEGEQDPEHHEGDGEGGHRISQRTIT